jgi:signal transduction histidine kinase
MLRISEAPPRKLLIRVLIYNLLISFFVAGVLMLRADVLSWSEFYSTLVPTLIYTYTCGLLTASAMFVADLWCCRARVSVQLAVLFCLGVLSGSLGEFIGSAFLILLGLKGPPGLTPLSVSFWRRVAATWIYVPLFVLVTLSFMFMIYGFEMLKTRLERTASALKEKELQAERLLKLTAEAELKALQARINPHFLFNTLNSIASLISEDPARAEEMTEKLSALFRYTLSADRGERVRLEQELHILRSYIDIEQLRLGSRLRFSIDVDERLQELSVPPLLLQPIVENSVKYAVAAREEGGDIRVLGRPDGDRCILEVVDDGPGFDGQTKGAGYALDNIRQRLATTYGTDHHFSISRADGKTIVQIEVPMAPPN